jgi:hypothetical protein
LRRALHPYMLGSMPWVAPPLPTALPDRLALIIEGLCQTVAARGPKAGAAVPLIVLVWGRLRRLSARFARLAAAVRDGRLSSPRLRSSPRAGSDARPATPRPPSLPQPRLPRGFGWLLRLVPGSAVYGSQIEHWLADPELASLLKEAPQAGRILRPLCRMLAIQPGPALRLTRRERLAPAATPDPAIPAAPDRAAIPSGRPPDAPLGSSPRAGSTPERPRRTRVRSHDRAGADPPSALPEPA